MVDELPVLLLVLLKLLVLLLLLLLFALALLLTACPETRPCNISAKFCALAYFKRKTFKPPKRSAAGTSIISIIWRMRLRVAVSPLIIIRLVRLSATMRTREPLTSFAAPVELIDSSKPMTSSA